MCHFSDFVPHLAYHKIRKCCQKVLSKKSDSDLSFVNSIRLINSGNSISPCSVGARRPYKCLHGGRGVICEGKRGKNFMKLLCLCILIISCGVYFCRILQVLLTEFHLCMLQYSTDFLCVPSKH